MTCIPSMLESVVVGRAIAAEQVIADSQLQAIDRVCDIPVHPERPTAVLGNPPDQISIGAWYTTPLDLYLDWS